MPPIGRKRILFIRLHPIGLFILHRYYFHFRFPTDVGTTECGVDSHNNIIICERYSRQAPFVFIFYYIIILCIVPRRRVPIFFPPNSCFMYIGGFEFVCAAEISLYALDVDISNFPLSRTLQLKSLWNRTIEHSIAYYFRKPETK